MDAFLPAKKLECYANTDRKTTKGANKIDATGAVIGVVTGSAARGAVIGAARNVATCLWEDETP